MLSWLCLDGDDDDGCPSSHAPPEPDSFPFSVHSISGSQCYQMVATGNTSCFQTFWTLHGPQYASFCLDPCPTQFNYLAEIGE